MNNGLRQNEIAAIKDKRWQLDFNLMKCVCNDGSHCIEGPGYIRMEPDGRMVFKLYPGRPLDIAQGFKWFAKRFNKLIPTEKCYTLTATDFYGRTWEAVNVLPVANFDGESNVPVTGNIYGHLKGCSKAPYKYAHGQLSFRCLEKYDFPFNAYTDKYQDKNGKAVKTGVSLDTAKFSINELDFLLTSGDNQFVMVVTSKNSSIPDIVETRAIESLQFLLGRAIDWHIFEKHENSNECIKVQLIHAATGAIYPPLRYRGPREAEYWQLYTRYFEYICQNQDEKNWHPISIFIHRILESRKASIETQCLVICVVVEGLLRTEFRHLAKPATDVLNWIDRAKCVLNQSNPPSSILNRIAGLINSMKRAGAIDQLRVLHSQGIITEKEKDIWRKLRNSSTHPERAFFENLEEAVDAFDTVLTLFYKLIFHRIGYCGKYTDYGTPDMTDAIFQPKA